MNDVIALQKDEMSQTSSTAYRAFGLFNEYFIYPPELKLEFNDRPARYMDTSSHGLVLYQQNVGFRSQDLDDVDILDYMIRELCNNIMKDIKGASVLEFSEMIKVKYGAQCEVISDGKSSIRVTQHYREEYKEFETAVEVLYGTA